MNKNVEFYYRLVVVIGCVISVICPVTIMAQNQNVVLIMVDDMGYECIGANGGTEYLTPNIDRIAKKSLRFTHCFSQPLCTPSRVKIMTGQYNFRNYEYFGYLNENQKTFGTLMQEAGYKTCIVGKWQLNGQSFQIPGYDDPKRPQRMGFDEFALWQVTNRKGGRYANPYINTNGVAKFHGDDVYGPDVFTDYAIDFIKRNKNQPFFLYYPMVLVHNPFVPTPDSPEWSDPEKRMRQDTSFFTDMVQYTDKIVGHIEQVLKDEGLYDNTIFIFTGDNGTNTSILTKTKARIVRGAKGNTITDGTQVPLIINWPQKVKKGRVIDELISFADFYPTLAELVNNNDQTDGQSFLPILEHMSRKKPVENILVYYDPMWGSNVNKHRGYFAQNAEYKLYNSNKFYNIKDDVLENDPIDLSELSQTEREIYQDLNKKIQLVPSWSLNGGQRPKIGSFKDEN